MKIFTVQQKQQKCQSATLARQICNQMILPLGIYGNYSIKHEFDPTKFLPSDSYLYKWFDYSRIYFPDRGDIVTIHIAEMDIYENFDTLVR